MREKKFKWLKHFFLKLNRKKMDRYNAKLTERKWQKVWEAESTYLTSEDKSKAKYYVLEMLSMKFDFH